MVRTLGGVVVKKLDFYIVGINFELLSHYYAQYYYERYEPDLPCSH